MTEAKRIAVIGAGYVGLSLAVLLSRQHRVFCLDVDVNRVGAVNARMSPFSDPKLEQALREPECAIVATTDPRSRCLDPTG